MNSYTIFAIIILILLVYLVSTLNLKENDKYREQVSTDATVNKEPEINILEENTKDVEPISNENFESSSASLDYNMGKYSNLILKKKNEKNFALKPPAYTSFGTPNPLTYKKSLEPKYPVGPPVDGQLTSPRSMAMFKYNFCKPDCCPSTYSCSNGCVCLTKEQKKYINKRGYNRTIMNSLQ